MSETRDITNTKIKIVDMDFNNRTPFGSTRMLWLCLNNIHQILKNGQQDNHFGFDNSGSVLGSASNRYSIDYTTVTEFYPTNQFFRFSLILEHLV